MKTKIFSKRRNFKKRGSLFWVSLICIITMMVACIEPDELTETDDNGTENNLSQEKLPVLNGQEDAANEFAAVVYLKIKFHWLGFKTLCTGTFIAHNLILTAAHCLPDCPYSGKACASEGNWAVAGEVEGSAYDGVEAGDGNEYELDWAYVPDSYQWGLLTGSYSPNTPDVIILKTKDSFAGKPMNLMGPNDMITPKNYQLYKNKAVTIVGYSDNEDHDDDRIRRIGKAYVSGFADNFFFHLNSSTKQCHCKGDSGGPILYKNPATGEHEIMGVVSGKPTEKNPCNSNSGDFAMVEAYVPRQFIDQMLCGQDWIYMGTDPTNVAAINSGGIFRMGADGRLCLGKSTPSSFWSARLRKDGSLYRWDIFQDAWKLVDKNIQTFQIALAGNDLYKLHKDDGTVWLLDSGSAKWRQIELFPDTSRRIYAGDSKLFQVRKNGFIMEWDKKSDIWRLRDISPQPDKVAYGAFGLVQFHKYSKTLWKYGGGTYPNFKWQVFGTEPNLIDFRVGYYGVYALIWDYSQGNINKSVVFRTQYGFSKLDTDPNIKQIEVVMGMSLYEFIDSGPYKGDVFEYDIASMIWTNLGGGSYNTAGIFHNVATY